MPDQSDLWHCIFSFKCELNVELCRVLPREPQASNLVAMLGLRGSRVQFLRLPEERTLFRKMCRPCTGREDGNLRLSGFFGSFSHSSYIIDGSARACTSLCCILPLTVICGENCVMLNSDSSTESNSRF
jgi:hypothetical protein